MRGTLILALAGIVSLAACAADETTPDPLDRAPVEFKSDPKDIELIQTLLARNLEGHNKILSLRLEQEWIRREGVTKAAYSGVPEGKSIQKQRMIYLQRGQWYRFDHTYNERNPSTGVREDIRNQAILTDSFFALLPSLTINSIRYVDNVSIAEMSEKERRIAYSSIPIHAGKFGFDIGPEAIGPQLLRFPDLDTWTVKKESADSGLYIITKSHPRLYDATYIIDSQKGYLITKRVAHDKAGKELINLTVTPEKFGGIWFPVLVDKIDSMNRIEFHLKVIKAVVNGPIADSEFAFDTLAFDRGTATMQRVFPNMEQVTMVYRDNQWVEKQ